MAKISDKEIGRQLTWSISRLMSGIAFAALVPMHAFAQSMPPEPAAAQDGAASQAVIGDIIVTAQKRSESVQRTPIAITAVSGDNLRTAGISTVAALVQSVPSIQLGQFYGVANVSLRGITLSAINAGVESPIAFHVDGIYYGRPASILSSFFDVQRVEVLRGAQGTLYGRNATGGSINVITVDPTDELSGFAQLTYGNYDHLNVEAGVGGPLSDKVQVRVAGRWDSRSGYGVNEATGRKIDDNRERAIRGKIKFLPTDNLTILLEGDYSKARSNAAIHLQGTVSGGPLWGTLSSIGGTPFTPGVGATKLRNVSQDYDPFLRTQFWGLGSTISLDLGSVTLRSLTGYRRSRSVSVGDIDLTSAPLISPFGISDNARQFSQELQLVGQTDRSNWILGAYYFHEMDEGREVSAFSNVFLPLFGAPLPPQGVFNAQGLYSGTWVKTDAYALFGQYTYKFTDQLSVTLGGRYSIETKGQLNQNTLDLGTPFDYSKLFDIPSTLSIQCGRGVPTLGYGNVVCDPRVTFKAFTPKIGVDFQIDPNSLLYASYTKGFKSGTYNLGIVQDPVRPEKLDDFELGLKTTVLDGRLRLNLAGFYYNYKDVQVYNGKPTQTVLENAAAAKIYGIELELAAKPIPALQFDVNGAYLHSTYSRFITGDQLRPGGDGVTFTDANGVYLPGATASTPGAVPAFNLKGNRLPQSPSLSGRAGAAYTVFADIGDFTLRGEAAYTGKLYITQFNTSPVGAVKAHTRFNLSLTYADKEGHLYASINAKNLGNKVLLTNGFAGTPLAGGIISGYLEAPRTVDFTVGYKF